MFPEIIINDRTIRSVLRERFIPWLWGAVLIGSGEPVGYRRVKQERIFSYDIVRNLPKRVYVIQDPESTPERGNDQIIVKPEINSIADLKGKVEVTSAAPLWWRDMCFWTRSSDGRQCLQVNLVNPPKAAEVMENPRSEITPPVRDITVTCAPSNREKPTAAHLITSEPIELTGLNEIQVVKLDLRDAGDGKVAVAVASVLFWKMVVFEW